MIPIKRGTARRLGLVLPQRKPMTAIWFDGDALRRPDLPAEVKNYMAFDGATTMPPVIVSFAGRVTRVLADDSTPIERFGAMPTG